MQQPPANPTNADPAGSPSSAPETPDPAAQAAPLAPTPLVAPTPAAPSPTPVLAAAPPVTPRKRCWLRRFYLMEDAIAHAKAHPFGKASPGHREYLIADASNNCANALRLARPSLRLHELTPASLTLLRETLWWTLSAHALRNNKEPPATPQQAWDTAMGLPECGLSTQTQETLSLAYRTFAERTFITTANMDVAEATKELVALRQVTEQALSALSRATVSLRYLRIARLVRWMGTVALVGGLVAASIFGIRWYLRGPNIALHRPVTTSSTYPNNPDPTQAVDGVTSLIGFHTQEEDNPWIRIDLGSPRMVRQVTVYNRTDYRQRALPLVVELSMDGSRWTEVVRRDKVFGKWEARFTPTNARYVRLRAASKTYLHLNEVEVYAGR